MLQMVERGDMWCQARVIKMCVRLAVHRCASVYIGGNDVLNDVYSFDISVDLVMIIFVCMCDGDDGHAAVYLASEKLDALFRIYICLPPMLVLVPHNIPYLTEL